jgi:hypothetical protein
VHNIDLMQFIVPLTFLAIWALTSLFNREAQPLPPRPGGRPLGAGGPRPGGPALPPRPPARGPESLSLPGDPTLRWPSPAAADRPALRRPESLPDDDLLIIRSEPARPSTPAPPRPGGAAPQRRAPRGRAPAPASPKRAEPALARTLSGTSGQGIAPQVNRHLELAPLTKEPTIAAAAAAPIGSPATVTTTPPVVRSPLLLAGVDLRSYLGSPTKLREAVILFEVLQPPLARRGPRNRPL